MTGPPTLSAYEQQALANIHRWKQPRSGLAKKSLKAASWPFDKAGTLLMDAPGIGAVIEKTAGGIIEVSNSIAQRSVRPAAIYKDFSVVGGPVVNHFEDIFRLDLADVDLAIGNLATKYKSLAVVEGGATGALGLPGIPADIIALVALDLRAIREIATYCGFELSSTEEKLYALNILGYVSSPNHSSKRLALAQLIKIAKEVAKKKVIGEHQKQAFAKLIQNIARALGLRLTKAKLAQIVPATGALVGGGFNAYHAAKVCDAAYHFYRERFLAEKYGPDVIATPVPPAQSYRTAYQRELTTLQRLKTKPAPGSS